MRDLALLTFVSLDGVMQGPSTPDEDTSGGFTRGGWARPWWDEVMGLVGRHAMAQPYDLLLGRTTYDLFAGHFATATGPEADLLNGATKHVVTSSPDTLAWSNSHAVATTGGDEAITAAIDELKQQDGPLLQVHGSWRLVQTLLAGGLVDELRLFVFPIVVGQGKRLFPEAPAPGEWELAVTEATPGGATMTIHRRRAD